MTRFSDSLERLAADGARDYSATPAPESYVTDYVTGVRRIRRRRSVGMGVSGALALALVVAFATQFIAGGNHEPAGPAITVPPGEIVWKHDLGSESWSAPALAGENIVVGANDGVVRAVSYVSGEPAWEFAADGAVRSGITVAGDAVVFLTDNGSVYCLSLDGDERWRTTIGEVVSARDPWEPYSSTPQIADGVAYVGSPDGTLYALDAASGAVVWTFVTSGPISTPPAVGDGAVYVGNHDGRFYAVDAATGVELWSQSLGGAIESSAAVADGVVVSGSRATSVVGYDAATGERLWAVSMGTSWADSSVDIADGVAYFGSSAAGRVVAADLHTGVEVWRSTVGGFPWARPTAAGSTVYAASGGAGVERPDGDSLFALDSTTGAAVWSLPTGEALQWAPEGRGFGVMAAPLVVGHTVVVVGLDGVLYTVAR